MGRLRCFVIMNGAECGLEPRDDRKYTSHLEHPTGVPHQKKLPDTRESPQPQSADSVLIRRARLTVMISQGLIEQLRNGLACAENLLFQRDVIRREMKQLAQCKDLTPALPDRVEFSSEYGSLVMDWENAEVKW